ncbi:MAG: PAS domain S-box protein [bacterium]
MSGNNMEQRNKDELLDFLLDNYQTSAFLCNPQNLNIISCNSTAKNKYFLLENKTNKNINEIYPNSLFNEQQDNLLKQEVDHTEFVSGSVNILIKKLRFQEKDYLLIVENNTDNKQNDNPFTNDNFDFKTIIDNMVDIVAKISITGLFIYISPNCFSILGYHQNELIGKSVYDFFHPDDIKELIEYGRIELRRNTISSKTIKVKKKGGKSLWIETKNKILRDEITGKAEHVISIIRDITEKKLEDEILNARLRLREFADNNSLNALLQKTLEEAEKLTDSKVGFFHFVNQDQKTVQLQEWSANTIDKFCERVYDEHAYDISKAGVWIDCFYTKAPVIHNNYSTLPHKKGMPKGHAQVVRMLTVPVKRKNKVVAVLGIGNKETDYNDDDVKITSLLADLTWDIAEKKIDENILREEQIKLQSIYYAAPIGIGISFNRVLLEINDTICKMVGYNKNELLMQNTKILYLTENEYNIVAEEIAAQFNKNGQCTLETQWKKKDGSVLEILINAIPLDPKNFNSAVTFTALDITGRKENERNLKNLLNEVLESNKQIENNLKEKNELIQMLATSEEKLKRSNSEKDKFFSIISHDLRSPFQGFIGISQLFAEHFELLSSVEIKELSKELLNSATNLYKLLENLLEWSKTQRGSIDFQFSHFNLKQIITEVVVLLKKNAREKQQIINYNIDEKLEIFVDVNLINGVLRNLLSNAIKFSNIGGEITIEAIMINNSEIQISIKDNGVGLTETEMENLFKLDKKTSKAGTMGEPSTGLGLILCKEYLTKLNGKIWVQSELNKGTTFYFSVKTNN